MVSVAISSSCLSSLGRATRGGPSSAVDLVVAEPRVLPALSIDEILAEEQSVHATFLHDARHLASLDRGAAGAFGFGFGFGSACLFHSRALSLHEAASAGSYSAEHEDTCVHFALPSSHFFSLSSQSLWPRLTWTLRRCPKAPHWSCRCGWRASC